MTTLSRLRLFYLFHLSKPASNRLLYRTLHDQKARRILELGIGDGQRAARMIEVAKQFVPPREVHYVGLDLFEARTAAHGPGMSLKAAHCLLIATGARIRLIPGEPFEGLARTANSLGPFDLVLISSCWHSESLAGAWFYLPRMLHADSRVMLETATGAKTAVRLMDAGEISRLAVPCALRRAA